MKRLVTIAVVLAPSLIATGCTLLTATPPTVEVQAIELRSVGILDQTLGVTLCVSNPNDSALDFRLVAVALDVADAPLASGNTESGVALPPHASILVPFQVVTTVRNIGPQLLGILRTGQVGYRVHGTVQLAGAFAITLPFSRNGHFDVASTGSSMTDVAAPGVTRCTQTSS